MSQSALHVWWWNDSGYQHLFVRHYYNKLKTCIDVILVVLSKLIVVLVFCIACIYCIICARHVSADIPVVLFYCHYKTRMNVTKLLTSALLCFFFFFFKTLKSNNWSFSQSYCKHFPSVLEMEEEKCLWGKQSWMKVVCFGKSFMILQTKETVPLISTVGWLIFSLYLFCWQSRTNQL